MSEGNKPLHRPNSRGRLLTEKAGEIPLQKRKLICGHTGSTVAKNSGSQPFISRFPLTPEYATFFYTTYKVRVHLEHPHRTPRFQSLGVNIKTDKTRLLVSLSQIQGYCYFKIPTAAHTYWVCVRLLKPMLDVELGLACAIECQ